MRWSKVKKMFGLLPQEYVCIALEDMSDSPSVIMTAQQKSVFQDVTARHVFLGYKPVVIAIVTDGIGEELQQARKICLSFMQRSFYAETLWRGFSTASGCIARLELTRLPDDLKIPGVGFYKAEHGEQDFLPLHQAIANRLNAALRRKPASEANVGGNEYDQVRIAYCVPRRISVITVKDDDLLNFFPTDLHGGITGEYYLSSLRIGGMACSQVERVKRIVISPVESAAFRETYGLGKNHMRQPRPAREFDAVFSKSESGIPIYPSATSYLELEWIRHWDVGIHRIFLYKVISAGNISKGKTLAHIHSHYAQWRINHHLSADYFYR